MSNVFLEASRRQLRFTGARAGSQYSVEDLWSLPMKTLDAIAVEIDTRVGSSRKSFLSAETRRTRDESEDLLRLEILKEIIQYREVEAEKAKQRADRQARRARLEELLAEKQDQELSAKSVDEIRAQIAALGDE